MRRVWSRLVSVLRSSAVKEVAGGSASAPAPADPYAPLEYLDGLVEKFRRDGNLVYEAGGYGYEFGGLCDCGCGDFAVEFWRTKDPSYRRQLNPGWHLWSDFLPLVPDGGATAVRTVLQAIMAGVPVAELTCGWHIGYVCTGSHLRELRA